ncbi:ribonuclease T2 [Sergentomyia squamirostris]
MSNLIKLFLSFGLLFLVGFCLVSSVSVTEQDYSWDLLIFTQQWPQTVCHRWKTENKNHKCVLPSAKNLWTIHGIWPTKYGKMGPFFCNSTWIFNNTEIAPIENQLELFWTNVELKGDQYDLWKHEWEKHGTCASVLPELNTEIRYFNQGLNWLHQYSMSSILANTKIMPDSTPTVAELHGAIVSQLNRNPVIHCDYDSKRGETFLAEIRICFNKSLELTDCDGVSGYPFHHPLVWTNGRASDVKIITNCDPSMKIVYPSIVPDLEEQLPPLHNDPRSIPEDNSWGVTLVKLYKIIQILKWATF